jgi:hypothetical protein
VQTIAYWQSNSKGSESVRGLNKTQPSAHQSGIQNQLKVRSKLCQLGMHCKLIHHLSATERFNFRVVQRQSTQDPR